MWSESNGCLSFIGNNCMGSIVDKINTPPIYWEVQQTFLIMMSIKTSISAKTWPSSSIASTSICQRNAKCFSCLMNYVIAISVIIETVVPSHTGMQNILLMWTPPRWSAPSDMFVINATPNLLHKKYKIQKHKRNVFPTPGPPAMVVFWPEMFRWIRNLPLLVWCIWIRHSVLHWI